MNNTRTWNILVLGGGYAGIMSANRLAGTLTSSVTITLVNPIPDFVERVRLHEVAARPMSESATRHSIRSLLHPAVRLRIATVTRILPDENRVQGIDAGSGIPWSQGYDELVYAVGSGDPFATVPGVSEHAQSISDVGGARAMRTALDGLGDGGSVLVVGGGTTAIELVTELAAARPTLRLTMATSSVLGPGLSAKGRTYLRGARAMRDVEVIEYARIAEVTASGVMTADGEHIAADCVVWAASFAVPNLARESGLAVDRAGRLVVNEFMRTPDRPNVLGAGDGCVIVGAAGSTLRMACATAAPQGAHTAATITAGIRGVPAEAFSLSYLVVAMSLGPGDGLVQRTNGDDSPRDVVLKGRSAAWFNELNNRYARLILAWERRRAGAYRWVKPRSTPR